MKRIMIIILCSTLLVGCKKMASVEVEEINRSNTSMFVVIEESYAVQIVYNKYTKVMYAVSHGGYNNGNFTLLVNADGTPMLYEPKESEK